MRGRLSMILCGGMALSGGSIVGAYWQPEESPRLIFLDVGQGDCAVVASGGNAFMVDAGPRTEDFDAGSRIVAPKLRALGIDRIGILFLTHPDSDHIGGLPGLAHRIRIEKVAAPAHFRGHPELSKCLEEAGISDRDILWLDRPLAGRSGELRFTLRFPQYSRGDPDNEGSLFLRFQLGRATAVFTGDANQETEAIEASLFDWKSDLLKAGHHGSATSTSKAWLAEVQPKCVIVSCGAGNSFGHPAGPTLERIQSAGARLYRTDLDGDLVFVPSDNGFVRSK